MRWASFLALLLLATAAGTTARAAPPGESTPGAKTLGELIVAGGYLMIPIGLLSVIGLAYTIERLLALRRKKLFPRELVDELERGIEAGDVGQTVQLCEERPGPLANVLRAGLVRWNRPLLEIEKGMEDAGMREVENLRRNLRPLRIVASVSPLLGLLGTVWGMIAAFQNVAEKHALGRPELLARGIYEALVTTGAGLAVAIPALLLFHYLSGKVSRLVMELDAMALRLVDRLLLGEESRV